MKRTLIKFVVVAAALAAVSFAVIVVNQTAQLVELRSHVVRVDGHALS